MNSSFRSPCFSQLQQDHDTVSSGLLGPSASSLTPRTSHSAFYLGLEHAKHGPASGLCTSAPHLKHSPPCTHCPLQLQAFFRPVFRCQPQCWGLFGAPHVKAAPPPHLAFPARTPFQFAHTAHHFMTLSITLSSPVPPPLLEHQLHEDRDVFLFTMHYSVPVSKHCLGHSMCLL